MLRAYETGDLFAIRDLVIRAIDACYTGIYSPEAIQFFKDYHSEEKIEHEARNGTTVVLEQDGVIVGTGTYFEERIFRVFVEPGIQRKGYGKKIMRHLEKAARASGADWVELDVSLPARSFYDALGYRLVRDAKIPLESGDSLDYHIMEKRMIAGP